MILTNLHFLTLPPVFHLLLFFFSVANATHLWNYILLAFFVTPTLWLPTYSVWWFPLTLFISEPIKQKQRRIAALLPTSCHGIPKAPPLLPPFDEPLASCCEFPTSRHQKQAGRKRDKTLAQPSRLGLVPWGCRCMPEKMMIPNQNMRLLLLVRGHRDHSITNPNHALI